MRDGGVLILLTSKQGSPGTWSSDLIFNTGIQAGFQILAVPSSPQPIHEELYLNTKRLCTGKTARER